MKESHVWNYLMIFLSIVTCVSSQTEGRNRNGLSSVSASNDEEAELAGLKDFLTDLKANSSNQKTTVVPKTTAAKGIEDDLGSGPLAKVDEQEDTTTSTVASVTTTRKTPQFQRPTTSVRPAGKASAGSNDTSKDDDKASPGQLYGNKTNSLSGVMSDDNTAWGNTTRNNSFTTIRTTTTDQDNSTTAQDNPEFAALLEDGDNTTKPIAVSSTGPEGKTCTLCGRDFCCIVLC
ncbi:uncharacterized protein LOC131933719 [Physella acuta]|uniref:uncharacterized protein LOC131933719 n=1 Tax=Physella acuta TaxID=109671 RepID=UPI0027DAE054|nr:uncharacterized protein LOC131933719 [Physella acuta]